jgi:hypothetical protein
VRGAAEQRWLTVWGRGAAVGALGLAIAGVVAAAPPGRAAAQATTAPAPPPPYVFQDNDPYMVYTGVDWTLLQDPKAQGGTVHQARAAGSTFRMDFTGPYFKWYGITGPNRGRARVIVDGVEAAGSPFDLYKPGDTSYELILWLGGLDGEKKHTLVIEALGQRNGASTDTVVALDAIEVQSAERSPLAAAPAANPTAAATPSAAPAAQASPTAIADATPAPTAAATGTPVAERSPGSWPIETSFLRHYVEYDGLRILGNTLSPSTVYAGYRAQYFEKGRIEDHIGESTDPNWRFLYGLLVDELQIARVPLPVAGETSTLSYGPSPTALINVADLAQELRREPPPPGFAGGTMARSDGAVFVPYSQALRPAPGHNISSIFWPYINRRDIFPGGWLHDVGLPMTEPITAVVTKGTLSNRNLLVQVFQRTILTYDPLNPTDFQIERANVGTDYRRAFPDRVPQ